jgi:hypothetical protein
MMELLKDLWGFMRVRKKFWLAPIMLSRRLSTPYFDQKSLRVRARWDNSDLPERLRRAPVAAVVIADDTPLGVSARRPATDF